MSTISTTHRKHDLSRFSGEKYRPCCIDPINGTYDVVGKAEGSADTGVWTTQTIFTGLSFNDACRMATDLNLGRIKP